MIQNGTTSTATKYILYIISLLIHFGFHVSTYCFFMLRFVVELKKFQTAHFILTDTHVCGGCFETGVSGTWMRVLKQLKFKRMQQNNRD